MERGKEVVISSRTHKHTNIMHFCKTYILKLRMDWIENEERKWSFLVLHIHTSIIHFWTTHLRLRSYGLVRERGSQLVVCHTHTFSQLQCLAMWTFYQNTHLFLCHIYTNWPPAQEQVQYMCNTNNIIWEKIMSFYTYHKSCVPPARLQWEHSLSSNTSNTETALRQKLEVTFAGVPGYIINCKM